jgi:hypothetical protein
MSSLSRASFRMALPEKIVVVGDGRQTGFGNDLGNGQAEGNVERDGQRIFGNQEIDLEFGKKIV